MRMIDILERKRDGAELTQAEIDWVISLLQLPANCPITRCQPC